MTTPPVIDTHKTEAFLDKVIGDAGGMTTTIFAAIDLLARCCVVKI